MSTVFLVAARIGIPLKVRIDVIFDDEAKVFVATSEDLKGLVVEAATVEELWAEIKQCACDLLIEECQAKLRARYVRCNAIL